MSTHPEWVKVGAKVAVVSGSGWGLRADETTIERVLTRDIVISSGDRFAKSTYGTRIHKRGHASSYHRAPELLPADHPTVIDIRQEMARQRTRSQAANAHEKWWRESTIDNADAAIAALEAWKATQ